MNYAIGFLIAVILLLLKRISKRFKLSKPPIRTAIISTIAIPILIQASEHQAFIYKLLTAENFASLITLLWTISLIKLVSWAILEVPADLGW